MFIMSLLLVLNKYLHWILSDTWSWCIIAGRAPFTESFPLREIAEPSFIIIISAFQRKYAAASNEIGPCLTNFSENI